MRSPLWKNPKILSTLFFVFLSGAVAGAFSVLIRYDPERHPPPPQLDSRVKELMPRFKKELDLNPQQEAEIDQILADYMQYVQLLEEQMNDVRATGKKRIQKVLREDQQAKFEHLMAELRAKR